MCARPSSVCGARGSQRVGHGRHILGHPTAQPQGAAQRLLRPAHRLAGLLHRRLRALPVAGRPQAVAFFEIFCFSFLENLICFFLILSLASFVRKAVLF